MHRPTFLASLTAIFLAFVGLQVAVAQVSAEVAATNAYYDGEYGVALSLIQPLADQGNPHAEVDIAGLYLEGKGVPKNEITAYQWYRKAADQGYAAAKYLLALRYMEGVGVPRDEAEAGRLLREAAGQGFFIAEFMLGQRSWFGLSRKPSTDPEQRESDYWLRKAAEDGVARAQVIVALSYSTHLDSKADQVEAVRWYRKAAEQGDASGQEGLAEQYAAGRGLTKDFAEAAKWSIKAAEGGDTFAQLHLVRFFALGEGVPRDVLQGQMWSYILQRHFQDGLGETVADLESFGADKPTPDQMAEAKRLADDWVKRHPTPPQTPDLVPRWISSSAY